MTIPEPIPSTLIGKLFVERGLISQTQLAVALQMQQETGKQLGQILVERFGVARKEVASVVAEQWARLGSPAEGDDVATRRRLGDIFVDRGFVSEQELELALQRQRQTGERLGEALVAQGVISKFELAGALAEQTYVGDTAADDGEEATLVQLPTRDDPEPARPFLYEPLAAPATYDPSELVEQPADPGDAVEPPLPAVPVEVVEPPPASGPAECVAFAATPTGYRLVSLARAVSAGDVVDVPDVGRLVALRVGRSPLPFDDRPCVFLELPLGAPA